MLVAALMALATIAAVDSSNPFAVRDAAEQVHDYVEARAIRREDRPGADTWARASRQGWQGDCEDLVLEKMALLEQVGVGRQRMQVWIVVTELGLWHTVLVVDGRWVADNRHPDLRTRADLEATGYLFSCRAIRLGAQAPTPGSDLTRCQGRPALPSK
jgi:hypothetical protein